MKGFLTLLLVSFVLGWLGCDSLHQRPSQQPVKPLTEKQLLELTRNLLRQERKRIDAFVSEYHWPMKESGTGLRFQILRHGKGPKARTGQVVKIRYSIKLLNGQKVYSGVKTFRIGYGKVENGLEEGILLLKNGDEARFILPSHLAYGLSGDGDKIPPHTPIIYYVQILKLK